MGIYAGTGAGTGTRAEGRTYDFTHFGEEFRNWRLKRRREKIREQGRGGLGAKARLGKKTERKSSKRRWRTLFTSN